MISFKTFFKQKMARFFSVLFASLLLLANLAVYLISSVQYTKQMDRQETAFITMLQHLIIYESIDTSIIYAEHYDHTHGINLVYMDKDGFVLYASEILPENGKVISINDSQGVHLGQVTLDYRDSLLGREVTLGLILFNAFSLLIFSIALFILYKYLNKQNDLIQKDMDKIGMEQKDFMFQDMSRINERYVTALRAEKDLKEMQTHYVQILAHDVKTPLTVLKAYLEGIQLGRLQFNETVNKDLLFEIDTMEKLVPQFIAMDMTQIEKMQNIKPIILNQLNKLDEVFRTKQMHLVSKIDDFEIKVSAVDISRIVEHLVFNAFYYSNPKGIVRVILDSEKRTLSVEDTGIGMSQDTIDQIQNGPFRNESSIHFNKKGSGIGMQIVFEIVKRMKAEIHIRSELNVGTTIEIKF